MLLYTIARLAYKQAVEALLLMYLNVFVRLAGTRLGSAIEVCKCTLWNCLQMARRLYDSLMFSRTDKCLLWLPEQLAMWLLGPEGQECLSDA